MAAGATIVAVAGTAPRAAAALLVADNFDTVATGANLNGRVPPTNNGRPWAAATAATASTTVMVGNGAGGLSGDSAAASTALVDLGAGYLSANKGVYSIAVDITRAASARRRGSRSGSPRRPTRPTPSSATTGPRGCCSG